MYLMPLKCALKMTEVVHFMLFIFLITVFKNPRIWALLESNPDQLSHSVLCRRKFGLDQPITHTISV